MKAFNTFIFLTFLFFGSSLMGQEIITITEDTVIPDSWIFTENTIIQGEGLPTLTLNGEPKFVVDGCRVLIKNIKLASKANWGTVTNGGILEWYGIGMEGSMQDGNVKYETYLDGEPKENN